MQKAWWVWYREAGEPGCLCLQPSSWFQDVGDLGSPLCLCTFSSDSMTFLRIVVSCHWNRVSCHRLVHEGGLPLSPLPLMSPKIYSMLKRCPHPLHSIVGWVGRDLRGTGICSAQWFNFTPGVAYVRGKKLNRGGYLRCKPVFINVK